MKTIIINPVTLTLAGKTLADANTLSILDSKHIQLKLSVFDSDPDDSEKPVIVLLHGNSSSKRAFDAQIEHYREKYRVISIDLVGHGNSTKFSELDQLSSDEKEVLGKAFYTIPAMVAEVVQVLKEENIEGANFVGWSLGGHIAYGVAVEAPELVASIVSIGSPPIKMSADGLRHGFSDWFVSTLVPQWVEHPTPTSAEEAAMIRGMMGFDEVDTFFAEDMMGTDPLVRRHIFLDIEKYNTSVYDRTVLDGEHFVRSTDLPICLLVGDKDMGINHELIASFSSALQNEHSIVHLIPGAQHAVFKTNPNEYHKIVDEFLDTVSPSLSHFSNQTP